MAKKYETEFEIKCNCNIKQFTTSGLTDTLVTDLAVTKCMFCKADNIAIKKRFFEIDENGRREI
jgi:hypothetical protein